jgi:hypothetical protein
MVAQILILRQPEVNCEQRRVSRDALPYSGGVALSPRGNSRGRLPACQKLLVARTGFATRAGKKRRRDTPNAVVSKRRQEALSTCRTLREVRRVGTRAGNSSFRSNGLAEWATRVSGKPAQRLVSSPSNGQIANFGNGRHDRVLTKRRAVRVVRAGISIDPGGTGRPRRARLSLKPAHVPRDRPLALAAGRLLGDVPQTSVFANAGLNGRGRIVRHTSHGDGAAGRSGGEECEQKCAKRRFRHGSSFWSVPPW